MLTPDELERLADVATPGPWKANYGRYPESVVEDSPRFAAVSADPPPEDGIVRRAIFLQDERQTPEFADNARLIALAPQLAREHAALLRWKDEVLAAADALGTEAQQWADQHGVVWFDADLRLTDAINRALDAMGGHQ